MSVDDNPDRPGSLQYGVTKGVGDYEFAIFVDGERVDTAENSVEIRRITDDAE